MRRSLSLFPFVLLSLVMLSANALGQDHDGNEILKKVKEKFLLVKDYEAKVKIKVDVDFIKIPVKNGTIWFMQPDQVKVKTQGFSLLPKRGMNFSPNQLLTGDYTAIYSKEEKIDNVVTQVIKILPENEDDDVILSKLWVDTDRNIIRKLEATTKSQGTFTMNFIFSPTPKKYDLPDQIIFNFDLRKNELPLGLTGDFEAERPKEKASKNTRGIVTISYLEYTVNQGKAEAVFKK